MADDLNDIYSEIRRLSRRVERLESGSDQESQSLDRGRMRIGEGEFLVDGDGLFRLVGTFDQTGTYNLLDGGNFNVENGGNVNVNGGGDLNVNSGGDIDVTSGGNVTARGGGNITAETGGNIEVRGGGNLNVRDNGNLTISGDAKVAAGGVLKVDGPTPLVMQRYDIQGSPQAALRWGDQYVQIYGSQDGSFGYLDLQAVGVGIRLHSDGGITMYGVEEGTASHVLGIDGAGSLVRMPAGTGGNPGGPVEPGEDLGHFMWPFSLDVVTSEFGMRNGRLHAGIDFSGGAAVSGGPIPAAGDGEVIERVVLHSGWGNYVKIKHTLTSGREVATLYAHMIEPAPVAVGQTVSKGDVIGRVGNTGNSFGAHLHFETWNSLAYGSQINPREFMAAYGPE